MFTDASKYAWSLVLTQEYTSSIDQKMVSHHHPINYISGLFQGSQLDWTRLMK